MRMVDWRQTSRRSSDTMRKNTRSSADDGDADESLDDAHIEPVASSALRKVVSPGAEGLVTAPGWMKRLSLRGKLARALIVALVLLVALLVVLPHSAVTLPPAFARL